MSLLPVAGAIMENSNINKPDKNRYTSLLFTNTIIPHIIIGSTVAKDKASTVTVDHKGVLSLEAYLIMPASSTKTKFVNKPDNKPVIIIIIVIDHQIFKEDFFTFKT